MKYIFYTLICFLPHISYCQNIKFETGTNLNFGKGAFKTKGSISAGFSLGMSHKISEKADILLNSEVIYFQNHKGTTDDTCFIPIKVGISRIISVKHIYLFMDGGTGKMIYTYKTSFPYVLSSGVGWKKQLKHDYINCKAYFSYVNARSIPEYRWLTIQVAWGLNRKK